MYILKSVLLHFQENTIQVIVMMIYLQLHQPVQPPTPLTPSLKHQALSLQHHLVLFQIHCPVNQYPLRQLLEVAIIQKTQNNSEHIRELQARVLKGPLEAQRLNKQKLQLKIELLRKVTTGQDYTLSSSQMALLTSLVQLFIFLFIIVF